MSLYIWAKIKNIGQNKKMFHWTISKSNHIITLGRACITSSVKKTALMNAETA